MPLCLPDLQPATWLWYPGSRCLPNTFVLFRRELNLRGAPTRATGWIAADSRYRLEVNGSRIQWGGAPSDPRWLEADPLNLTQALTAGVNVIGATVLFYGHGDGTWPIGKPGFLFWLEVEYADGGRETIVSDAAWQAHLCRAWRPGQYKRWFLRALQEEFDARLYPHGWSTRGFRTDAAWLPAAVLEGSPNKPALATRFIEYSQGMRNAPPEAELRPRSVPMLREIVVPAKDLADSMWLRWNRPPEDYFECHPPDSFVAERQASAVAQPDGSWRVELDGVRAALLTFEFAEQIVGWPRFAIEAAEGTVVEVLLEDGYTPGRATLINTGRDNWTRFVCREGANSFETFDFETQRWLQLHIRGAAGTVRLSRVGVRRRIYPWPNEPRLRTSEPALQRLFDASINTLHNCAQDTLVDCMGRERQQYSGDCGHQLQAVRLTFGETRSPARFITTYSQGMTQEGYFLDCWPAYDRLARIAQRQLGLFHLGPILDHGVQLNFDCWRHYEYTGDLDALREPYPRLLRFTEYLRGLIDRDGDGLLPVENLGVPCVWMDYEAYRSTPGVASPFSQRHKQCAFNLYTAAMWRHALAPICEAFGEPARAVELRAVAAKILEATIRKFWCSERRLFIHNLPWLAEEKTVSLCDRSLATSILFDQCPQGDTAAAIETLANCPPEMGFSYPANAGWRLWALAKGGRPDAVLGDFRQRWATMVSVTLNNTLQEHFEIKPDIGQQWSHCAVSPLYITFEGLAGIRPLTPGFGRVEVRPQLGDLPDLDLIAYTGRGPLHFQAQSRNGGHDVRLDLPLDCEGELVLPEGEKIALPLVGKSIGGLCRYLLPGGKTQFHLAPTS